MKAKELRIGNLVDVYREDVHYGTIVIESITPYGVNERIGTYYAVFNKPMCDELLVKPITLTEEWLLKFGFENPDNDYRWVYGNDLIWVDLDDGGCALDRALIWLDVAFNLKIQYVHQLQNLYFALTNEELTIKND
jgi:hypothetical protein